MNVLVGMDVDLVEPFPSGFLPQAAEWMHCQKTFMFGDGGPQSPQDIQEFLASRLGLPFVRSWGMVDKGNRTHSTQSQCPLVGIAVFEATSAENGYVHVATNRKAWGERVARPSLTEQACQLAISALWEGHPGLQRLSGSVYERNAAAKSLLYRLGFQRDGYFKNMGRVKGHAVDVVHYALLRPQVSEAEKEHTYGMGIDTDHNLAPEPAGD